MKFRLTVAAFAAFSLFSASGWSHSVAHAEATHFTTEQRAEIVQVVRQALADDPSILSDAIHSLREKAAQQKEDSALAGIRSHLQELQNAPDYAIRGNRDGRITVVEFFDPRCSYCRSMMPEVDHFLQRHRDVRLVEKVIPVLGAGSVLDARAIYAASAQGKYEVMKKALMEDTVKPSETRIAELAKENGLDVEKLKADMNAKATITQINTNLSLGNAINLDGTPTFIFGSAAVAPGALSGEQMDEFLDQARKS